MQENTNYPIGNSDIKRILENKVVYIDKTDLIYSMVSNVSNYFFFLSRPRRFGKTLLVNTLEQIFLGNKELFKGLHIYNQPYDWQSYPILKFDFSGLQLFDSMNDLKKNFKNQLSTYYKTYNLSFDIENDIVFLTENLLKKILESYPFFVVLIDEYEAPIIEAYNRDPKLFQEVKNLFMGFYRIFKIYSSNIRFLFATGVTAMGKSSVLSGFNILENISTQEEYSTLCGYTWEEIQQHFPNRIKEIGISEENIKAYYNGFRFTPKDISVYNPISLLSFLKTKKLEPYWNETAEPHSVIEYVKKLDKTFDLEKFRQTPFESLTNCFNPDATLNTEVFLYQAGYFTIKDYREGQYYLDITNLEVKKSFVIYLLTAFYNITNNNARDIKLSLKNRDWEKFFAIIEGLLRKLPYSLSAPKKIKAGDKEKSLKEATEGEWDYHKMFALLLYAFNVETYQELQTHLGRIDTIFEDKDQFILFELKFNQDPQVALDQIKERKYAENLKEKALKPLLVGVSFNYSKKLGVEIQYLVEQI